MQHFAPGDFLPTFYANSNINPRFAFHSLSGHRLLLAFVGTVRSGPGRALAEVLIAQAERLRQNRIMVFVVTMDNYGLEDPVLQQLSSSFTLFWDHDRAIARLYEMDATPSGAAPGTSVLRIGALLIERNLRLHATIPALPVEEFATRLWGAADTLPQHESERLVSEQAPVLIIPDVLPRAVCRRFIDYYEAGNAAPSGFMRDIDGRTQGFLDPKMKRRKDIHIADRDLQMVLRAALVRRVVPEIRKAYCYDATRIERYIVACYEDSDKGFFGSHRDNETKATCHRAFAVSLNLNSEEYEGGGLRFPEYARHTYKPATGCAVVFSCSLLHEALPVTRGRRYVTLPFLYNDEAAHRRAENLKFLSDTPPTTIEAAPAGPVPA